MKVTKFKFEGNTTKLSDYSTSAPKNFNKEKTKTEIKEIVAQIDEFQNRLYAENKHSLLVIFQGIDAAGKDSSIRTLMTGVNPTGVEVTSFKTPTSHELEHDFLWRHYLKLPEKGKIGIFNRSHYENVLVCRVHPEFILSQNIPHINKIEDVSDNFFEERFQQINDFEKIQVKNGTKIIKFFLNISKKEQKKRFIKRIEEHEKNWKFSSADLKERAFWNEYQKAFEATLQHTSTEIAPWYVIPCDNKTYGQLLMANIILEVLKKMNPQFPSVDDKEKESLKLAFEELKSEKD